jgi:two-component system phosphate regulon sensor histidine kinase PhoR
MERRANTIQTITEDMQEGLVLLDKKGMILSANQSAIRLLGDEEKLYNGVHILQLTREMTIINHIKEALQGQSKDAVLTFGHKTMQVLINPVFENDRNNGVILLFLDITEKANAEQIRREFSANVSHELKTPLTSILGFSELLSSGMSKDDNITHFAGKINSEIKRLITLIDDIIKLSELDEGTGKKQWETFDLLDLAESVAEELAYIATEKNVSIQVKGEPLVITANQGMLGELLFNLLDNSIKNTLPGGKVTVDYERTDDTTTIQVTDTGMGIASEHLDRVFERFYQVDKSRTKKSGGTGLGLSIVKHIAQYHNGQASIVSEVGKGTTVTVVLK